MSKSKSPVRGLAIFFTLVFLAWGGTRAVLDIVFERDIGSALKKAASADSVELAARNLGIALKKLEAKEDAAGFTSLFQGAADEDVGSWCNELEAALWELQAIKPKASRLERRNALLTLRGILLNNTEGIVHVMVPPGISVFPHNMLYATWGWSSFIFSVLFWGLTAFPKRTTPT